MSLFAKRKWEDATSRMNRKSEDLSENKKSLPLWSRGKLMHIRGKTGNPRINFIGSGIFFAL
jgi:hypothetical protein